jgi:hypothetical protein
MTTDMTTDTVSRFLDAAGLGTGVPADLYAEGAVLDATVPMWRFEVHGPAAISSQLSAWFPACATFSELHRAPLPSGELLSFSLAWLEGGNPVAIHQVHLLELRDGKITHQEAWCGGRWDAALQAEIESGLQAVREGA